MSEPPHPRRRTDPIPLHGLSPELEEELIRRAQENGTDPAEEAADILEKHAREAGETE